MEKVTNLDFIKGFSKGDMSRVKKYIMMYIHSADEEMPVIEKSFQEKDFTFCYKCGEKIIST